MKTVHDHSLLDWHFQAHIHTVAPNETFVL